MQLFSKFLAAVIAVTYLFAAATVEGWTPELGGLAAILLLPLVLIWFPRGFVGGVAGHAGSRFAAPSPPIFISLAGWFFLVGMPAICLLIARMGA